MSAITELEGQLAEVLARKGERVKQGGKLRKRWSGVIRTGYGMVRVWLEAESPALAEQALASAEQALLGARRYESRDESLSKAECRKRLEACL